MSEIEVVKQSLEEWVEECDRIRSASRERERELYRMIYMLVFKAGGEVRIRPDLLDDKWQVMEHTDPLTGETVLQSGRTDA